MSKLFLSYRRQDTEADATALYHALTKEFGPNAVFKDVDNVPLGANWKDFVGRSVADSVVMILLIGPSWQPTEAVLLELREAARLRVPVLPILFRGARMEAIAPQLPADLQAIADLNAAKVDHESWERDLAPVIETLRPLLPASQPSGGPIAAATPASGPRSRGVPTLALLAACLVAVAAVGAVALTALSGGDDEALSATSPNPSVDIAVGPTSSLSNLSSITEPTSTTTTWPSTTAESTTSTTKRTTTTASTTTTSSTTTTEPTTTLPEGSFTITQENVTKGLNVAYANIEVYVKAGGEVELKQTDGPCVQVYPSDPWPPNTYRFFFESTESGTCSYQLTQKATPFWSAAPAQAVDLHINQGMISRSITTMALEVQRADD